MMPDLLPLRWHGDRLVFTDDARSSRVLRPHISPSAANALQSCGARYVIDSLTFDNDPMSPASLGTSAHSVLEKLYNERSDNRTLRTARELLTQVASSDIPSDWPKRKQMWWLAKVWPMVRGVFDIEDPTTIDVFATEFRFETEIGGFAFKGFADRIDVADDGTLVVIDYKTGKVKDTRWSDPHGDQVVSYAEAVEAVTGRKASAAVISYSTHGQERRIKLTAQRRSAMMARYADAAAEMAEAQREGGFLAKPGNGKLCPWCPIVSSCPSQAAVKFRSSGETPKKDQVQFETGGTATPAASIIGGMEDKPWNETNPDGTPNPNSYAMTAAVAMASTALEHIQNHDAKVTAANLAAVTGAFVWIATNAATDVFGTELRSGTVLPVSLQDGAHTRARAALHASLKSMPPPSPAATSEEWRGWCEAMRKRVAGVLRVASRIADSTSDAPWSAFGPTDDGNTPAGAFDAAILAA